MSNNPERDNINRILTISPYQQPFVLLDTFHPATCLITRAWRFENRPDPQAVKRATEAVVAKYPTLNTRFMAQGDKMIGIVERQNHADFACIDCSSDQLEDVLRQEANRPIDIANASLFRIRVIISDTCDYYLLLSIHHIAFDLHAAVLCIHEFLMQIAHPEKVVRADVGVEVARLTELNQVLEKRLMLNRAQLVDFWRAHLDGALNTPLLPMRGEPALPQSGDGGRAVISFTEKQMHAARELSRSLSISPFTLYLSVLYLLLYKYGNRKPFSLAVPVSLREGRRFHRIPGLFLNTIAVKLAPRPDELAKDFILRVDRVFKQCYKHRHLPVQELDSLCDESNREQRGMFNTLFAYQRLSSSLSSTIGGEFLPSQQEQRGLEPIPLKRAAPLYDITMTIIDTGTLLGGSIEYRREILDEWAITRLIGHYQRLLKILCSASSEKLYVRDIALETLNAKVPSDHSSFDDASACYLQQIHANLSKGGDAAVLYDSAGMHSCQQLRTATETIRRLLMGREYCDEQVIGVMCDSGLSYVAALLGILMAEKAVMPLSPDTPRERLLQLTEASGCRHILTTSAYAREKREALAGLQVEQIDKLTQATSFGRVPKIKRSGAAYLLFTSGSTGEPKGVLQRHACIDNVVQWQMSATGGKEKVLQYAPLGFDVSMQEILYALASQGTLYCVPRSCRLEKKWLTEYIVEKGVTILFMPFTALKLLLSDNQELYRSSLKHIVQAGEQLYITNDLKQLVVHTGCTVHNQYGPTETHVVTHQVITPQQIHLCSRALIGSQLPHAQLHIIDKDNQSVPDGVAGELCVAGEHVALGYLDAHQTAERFVRLEHLCSETMYRTGDLVTRTSSGALEYNGRIDEQVKIRGFRVEPGEVEQALRKHTAVKDACVIACTAPEGDNALIAYVIAPTLDIQALHSWVQSRLPDYMCPSRIAFLDTFPLTSSNKVDKRRLPSPYEQNARNVEACRASMSATQQILYDIWVAVLKSGSCNAHSNFFESGGSSISAVQVINRVNQRFSLQLAVQKLFEHPTIEALASLIDSVGKQEFNSIVQSAAVQRENGVHKEEQDTLYPLSYAQRMIYFAQNIDKKLYVYNMPGLFSIHGKLDTHCCIHALEQCIEAYEILRTVFQEKNGLPMQRILTAQQMRGRNTIRHYHIGEGRDIARIVRRYSRRMARKPFSLNHGPLVSFALFSREGDEEKHYLFVNIHHSICDAAGIVNIFRIFSERYHNLRNSLAIPEHSPSLQYRHYTLWHNERVAGGEIDNQLAYWKARKLDSITRTVLPGDHPLEQGDAHKGRQQTFHIPRALSRQLSQLAADLGVSVFALLLANVKILIHKLSGETAITTAVPTEGRTHIELESMPGLFINTIPSIDTIDPEKSFIQCAKNVFARLAQDMQNSEYPFERVVSECLSAHNPMHHPLTGILVSYHNDITATFSIDEAVCCMEQIALDSSRLDVSIVFEQQDESIHGMLEYDTSLYSQKMMSAFVEQLIELMHSAVERPHQSIAQLNYLTAAELHRLKQFEIAEPMHEPSTHLFAAFAAIAQKHGQLCAVEHGGESLIYSQLLLRARSIACFLCEQASAAEIIGIYMHRSVDMIVALFATLAADKAFVLLDPSLPHERVRQMIETAGCSTIIASEQTRSLLSNQQPSIQVLVLPEQWPYAQDADSSSDGYDADSIACIHFTSGSSGIPKGVMLRNRNLYHAVRGFCRVCDFQVSERHLCHTPLSFDAILYEIFVTLLTGQALVIADDAEREDPLRFLNFIEDKNIDAAFMVPSHISALGQKNLTRLKRILSAGERALAEEGFLARAGCLYVNSYGPCETTLGVSCWIVKRLAQTSDIPIGKPMAGNEILVLHQKTGDRVPIGATAEICVAGQQLSAGYVHDEQNTQRSFVPHPFRDGERIYRTGDLGCWDEQGNLHFRGRRGRSQPK